MFIALVMLMLLSGCRQQRVSSDTVSVQISLTVEPSPPSVGADVLIVTLLDERGDPIEGAAVQVRGDMSHAGMQPEFGEVESASNGVYRIPFEWTMMGDWILTVTATLISGETFEEQVEVSVE